jgi:sulfatase modifying factor 1
MNLTNQYVVNPKVKKAYSNSNAFYSSIQSSYTKISLNETRARLRPNNLRKVSFDVSGIIFKMIICPRCKFTMGSDIERDKNPKRVVSINKPFSLGETEVTQELFEKVMGFNPSGHQGKDYPNSNKRPIENITWYDALMFCNKLSERCKKKPYYNISNIEKTDRQVYALPFPTITKAVVTINDHANGFRLPLEKEWEYAAKAGTNNQFAGTNDPNKVGEVAWFRDNSEINGEGQTHPVKGKRPNEWGFYDMSGNVNEWCWDEYESSDYRVFRGGGWRHNASRLRSASRDLYSPDARYDHLGFRVSASLFN